MNVTDSDGNTSEEALVASFRVPGVKGESTVVSPEKLGPNYLTVSLVVLGALVLLAATYAFLTKKSRST